MLCTVKVHAREGITAAEVSAALGPLKDSGRWQAVRCLEPRIENGLNGLNLSEIAGTGDAYRSNIICTVKGHKQSGMNAAQLSLALGGLSGTQRSAAVKCLESVGTSAPGTAVAVRSSIGVGTSTPIAPGQATEAAPRITLVTGDSDGVGVELGRWNGQPAYAPATASNRYKGFLASDSYPYGSAAANPYYWDIHGSNFGDQEGTVQVGPAPSPFSSVIVVSWTPTKIRLKAVANRSYRASAITLRVIASSGLMSPLYRDNAVGLIKSRGFGQCTWEVAYQRLAAGLPIPERAYPSGTAIDRNYVPQRYDILFWSDAHTAIITSEPVYVVAADRLKTWTFTVTERNARWNEEATTRISTFKVDGSQVVEGILSEATRLGVATRYWR
jgi:hypothetical protein